MNNEVIFTCASNMRFCSYLEVPLDDKFENSEFYRYLLKELNFPKSYYGLKINDLIKKKIIPPSLILHELPETHQIELHKEYHFILSDSNRIETLSDTLHYFERNKEDIRKYETNATDPLTNKAAYLPYWYSYIIIETYEFLYSSETRHTNLFLDCLKKSVNKWIREYKGLFNFLTSYITIIETLFWKALKEEKYQVENKSSTFSDSSIVNYILETQQITEQDLFCYLEQILTIHQSWVMHIEHRPTLQLRKALTYITRDVNYLYDAIISLGVSRDFVLDKFTSKDRNRRKWSELSSVLPFEDIKLKSDFYDFCDSYLTENIKKDLVTNEDDPKTTYIKIASQLDEIDDFKVWCQATTDINERVNRKGLISFSGLNLINNLLLLTIKTESLLRCIRENIDGTSNNTDLIINKDKPCILDHLLPINILDQLKPRKTKTDLRKLTEYDDIFSKLRSDFLTIECSSKLKKQEKEVSIQILKFITFRNYFAHHHCLDNKITDPYYHQEKPNSRYYLASEIIKSCFSTVVYISWYLLQKNDNS